MTATTTTEPEPTARAVVAPSRVDGPAQDRGTPRAYDGWVAPSRRVATINVERPRQAEPRTTQRMLSKSSLDTSRLAHITALDGLRGIAVLAVVLYHFAPGLAPGGFLGVDIFFVLSGFLITSLLVNECESTSRIVLPRFWARRARRLLPALFLLLAVVGTWTLFLSNHAQAHDVAADGLAVFTYVANWHFISSGQNYIAQFVNQAPSPLRHMWSLAIEEQFYVVWPLLVGAIGLVALRKPARRGRSRRRFRRLLFLLCTGLGVASFVRMVTLYQSGHNVNRVYYGTDSRAFLLLAGAALGALSAGDASIKGRFVRRVTVGAGLVLAAGVVGAIAYVQADASWLYRGGYGLICLAITGVLLAAVQPDRNLLRRLLETRALAKLGLISYGVYLWHWPIFIWLTSTNTGVDGVVLFLLRSAATLGAAVVSYALIEQPIRRGRLPRIPRFANRGVLPAALITLVAFLLIVPDLAYSSVNAAGAVSIPGAGAASVAARYASVPHCTDKESGSLARYGSTNAMVQLAGNSVALEVAPCLESILAARGISTNALVRDATSICDLLPRMRLFATHNMSRPRAVILFALPIALTPCGQAIPWQQQAETAVATLVRAGVRVYLVPALGRAGTNEPDRTQGEYLQIARRYPPTSVYVLDAGAFLRDTTGRYEWTVPCLASGEAGCSGGTVGVRMAEDKGQHFCAHLANFKYCPADLSGGSRRAAAAIAAEVLSTNPFGR